jgi:hypothetical protein
MQITSLNRIIATLVVGSTVLVWLLFRGELKFDFSTIGNVGSGFSFVVVAIIIGTVIDAITDIMVNETIVKRARKKRKIAGFFLQGGTYDNFAEWKFLFQQVIAGSKFDLRKMCEGSGTKVDEFNVIRLTAIGIFFKEAGRENFEWMTASDAAFYLTGNLATAASLIWILEAFHDATTIRFWPFAVALVYVCIGRSINRDLYTDTVIFRFSTLFCLSNSLSQPNAALSA